MNATPITEDHLRQVRLLLEDGVGGFSNGAVASLVAEIDRLRQIINNAAADLNEESYPAAHRADRAFSHLMQCPEAVFGDFPHGPEAASKAAA
jgi:DNA-binding GntR family transcriptional regulator